MNYFNESFKEETKMKKSFDKTKIGGDASFAGASYDGRHDGYAWMRSKSNL